MEFLGGRTKPPHACGSVSWKEGVGQGKEGGTVLMGLIKYLIFTLGGAQLEVLSTAKLIRFRTCRQCEDRWMSSGQGKREGETQGAACQSAVPYAAKYFIKSLKIATATAADNRRPTSTTTLTTSPTTAGKAKKCSERSL